MEGQLEKLKIFAFKDSKYKEKVPNGVYQVFFNPQELKKNYKIEYSDAQAAGSTATNQKYNKHKPETLDLNLVFDGTGATGNELLGSSNILSVPLQIELFKKVTLEFKGETHSPRHLIIIWGTFIFKGRLTKFDLTYNLFNPNGIPLRAKASTTFIGSLENVLRIAQENKSSPDLTHIRTVKAGDTLPLMAYKIYGDSSYYLELAKANKIRNFRNLRAGDEIFFPPIEKSK